MSFFNDFARTAGLVGSMAASLAIAQAGFAKDAPVVVYGDTTNVRSEHVSFAGLDLASAQDARLLNLRVARAVKRVCLFDNERAKLQASDYYSCADGAWDNARPQIDRAIADGDRIASNGTALVTSIRVAAYGR